MLQPRSSAPGPFRPSTGMFKLFKPEFSVLPIFASFSASTIFSVEPLSEADSGVACAWQKGLSRSEIVTIMMAKFLFIEDPSNMWFHSNRISLAVIYLSGTQKNIDSWDSMLSELDIETFIQSMDELSRQTVQLIRTKENWVDDSNPEIMQLILEVDEKIKANPAVFAEVEADLGVRLGSKFDIGRSLVFLKLLSETQASMVYKMMNPENLTGDQSLLYQAVFMRRLTAVIKTPLVHEIYGSPARVSVVKQYLQKTINFQIQEDKVED